MFVNTSTIENQVTGHGRFTYVDMIDNNKRDMNHFFPGYTLLHVAFLIEETSSTIINI